MQALGVVVAAAAAGPNGAPDWSSTCWRALLTPPLPGATHPHWFPAMHRAVLMPARADGTHEVGLAEQRRGGGVGGRGALVTDRARRGGGGAGRGDLTRAPAQGVHAAAARRAPANGAAYTVADSSASGARQAGRATECGARRAGRPGADGCAAERRRCSAPRTPPVSKTHDWRTPRHSPLCTATRHRGRRWRAGESKSAECEQGRKVRAAP
jgi:hypothetical protein